jgi:hypothetical protein
MEEDVFEDAAKAYLGVKDTPKQPALANLDPDFAERFGRLQELLGPHKIREGYRDAKTQDEYYKQGRTKPGNIITYAKGGQSDHQYGEAVDLDPADGDYHRLGRLAKQVGLKWGGDWNHFKDWGHVYLDDKRKGRRSAPLATSDPFEASATAYLNSPVPATPEPDTDPFEASAQAYLDNKGGQKITPTVAAPVTVQQPQATPEDNAQQAVAAVPELTAISDAAQHGERYTEQPPPVATKPFLAPSGEAVNVPNGQSPLAHVDASKLFGGNARVSPKVQPPIDPAQADADAANEQIAAEGRQRTAQIAQKVAQVKSKQTAKQYDFQQTGKLTLPAAMGETASQDLTYEKDASLEKDGEYRLRDADNNSYIYSPTTGKIVDEADTQVLKKVEIPLAEKGTALSMAKSIQAQTVADAVSQDYPNIPKQDIEDYFKTKGFSDFQTKEDIPEERYYKGFTNPVTGVSNSATDFYNLTQRDVNRMEAFSQEKQQQRDKYSEGVKLGQLEGQDDFTTDITAKVHAGMLKPEQGDEIIKQKREIRQSAIDAIREERKANLSMGSSSELPDAEPTQEELSAKIKEMTSPENIEAANRIKKDAETMADRFKGKGIGGQAEAGLSSFAGSIDAIEATALRPFSSLPGVSDAYKALSEKAQSHLLSFDLAADDSWAGWAARHATKTAGDLVILAGLAKVPGLKGRMPLVFAAQAGTQAAGTGKSLTETGKAIAGGYLMGNVFEGATVAENLTKKAIAGRTFESPFEKQIWNGLSDAERSEQMSIMRSMGSEAEKRAALTANLVSKLAGGSVLVGGTAGMSKAESGKVSLDQIATNLFFHFGPGAVKGAADLTSKAVGRITRLWSDGKPFDYFLDADGQLQKTVKPVPSAMVETEGVTDPENPVYKQTTNETKTAEPSAPLGEKPLVQTEPAEVPNEVSEQIAKNTDTSQLPPLKDGETRSEQIARQTDEMLSRRSRTPDGSIPNGKPMDRPGGDLKEDEPKTVSHPNPAIDGKPVVAETADGKVIVANPENKSGVSVVTDRALPKGIAQNEKGETTYAGETEPQIEERRRVERDTKDITAKQVHNLATDKGLDVDSSEFKARTLQLTGQAKLDEMTPDELRQVTRAIENGQIKSASHKVFTERGTEASVTPAIVDASDIITSLDPNYPAELQPRDRSRVASKAQISDIANNLKPEFLDDSPKASDGRPLVVPMEIDGKTKYVVISGNGRTAAIKHAYDVGNEPSKAYAEFTRGKEANQLERPVYVGKLGPETDLQSFSREANESAVAQMSSTEQAKADAERLDAGALSEFIPSEDGSIHAAANRNFIRKFIQRVAGKTEQGSLVDENGQLSQDGIRRVRNAIFAKAYGERAVSRLAESTDDNIKRATNALLKVAPKMADLNEHVEGGTRHPGLNISHDVAVALEKFSTLKDEGTDVGTYLKQQTLFGDDLTPLQKRILVEFDNHKNSSKAIAGILDNYIHLAHELGDPKQTNLFGEPVEANAPTLFKEAVIQYEQGNEPRAKQTSLLDADKGREVQSETSEAPKADRNETRTVPEVRPKPAPQSDERLKPFEKNTVVTSDAVEKARALLKKKSTQLNTGIDPEELKAFATIGAAYIEAGARKFADFSRAMIDEFGNQIKPHLEKIYGMVREAHEFEGMDEPPKQTSIKNASVNADRAARGESPLEQRVKSVSNPETWNEANAKFRHDPDVGNTLVAELSRKMRPVDRVEAMILQQERVKRTQAFDKATDETNNAATDAEYTSAKLKQNIARAQLDDLEQVTKDVGTVGAQAMQIRQRFLAHDYSLARMEARAQSRLPRGQKLSEEQLATIKDQHDRIKDLEKQLEEHNRKQDDVATDEYFKRLFKNIDKSATVAKKQGVGVVDFISQQAQKARERQAAKGHQFSAGLDPRDLYDYALIGAEHLAKGIKAGADWTAEMVKEFGEAIKPHLEDIRKRAESIYSKHEKVLGEPKKLSPQEIVAKASKNAIEEIKSDNLLLTDEQAAAKFKDEQKGLLPEKGLVGKLVEAHVREGKKDLTEVIKAVKEDLKDVYPDASIRDIRDAFSDYGKTKFPSADEVKRSVSELRRLSQLTSAIEDANSGKAPKKTGFQRPEPTQPIRDKIKELDAAMREAGIEPSEADQLASTNKARVTALKNQIEDLNRQIETGIKPPKGKPVATNAEVDALRKKRDELKAQLPEEDQTVQKQELYKRNLERQINRLTTQIQTGEAPVKGKPVPTTPEIERLKIQRDALKAQLPEVDRSISDAQKLATRKKMIARRIGELQQKIQTGDFTRTVRKPLTLDREATQLVADQNAVKREYEKGQMKADKEERYRLNPQERYKDWLVHYIRESVLSSPGAIAKLTSAALETTGINTGEELLGYGLQRALPGLAKQAGVESTYGVKSSAFIRNEARAIAKGFTNLITDVGRKVSTGKLDFEDAFGPVKMPEELVSWMSRVHGGLKTIPMRSAFERYSARLNEVYMAKGIDVTDPLVQFEIGNKAYLKAHEAVFLNDNAISRFMGNLGRMLSTPDENGKVSYKKTAGALLLGSELPVVRVPTNLILRGGRAITGMPVGFTKLAVAYARGIEKLPEKQADLIIKQIKQGTPGAAIALLGYFAVSGSIPGVQIGGFYRKDAPKKKEGDVPYGAARVFGVDIPALVMHHPLFEALQFGASVRQVTDEVEKKDKDASKLFAHAEGLKAATWGMIKEVPYIEEVENLLNVMESDRGTSKFIGDTASKLNPQIIQWIARNTDRTGQDAPFSFADPLQSVLGPLNKRKPESVGDYIEQGIPGLRKNVTNAKPVSGVSDDARDAQMKHAKIINDLDKIAEMQKKGVDASAAKDAIEQRLQNKIDRNALTNKEAEKANQVFGTDEYEGQIDDPTDEDAPPPNFGKYNKNVDPDDVIAKVVAWAKAIGTDPSDAFDKLDKLAKGEYIARQENGELIVLRRDKWDPGWSEKVRKKLGGGGKTVKLDHTIPLELGGTNAEDNLRLVTTEEWQRYSPMENYLAGALHDGKISGKQAKDLIKNFKNGWIGEQDIVNQVGEPFNGNVDAPATQSAPSTPFKAPKLRLLRPH